jgi:hypothetical protein
MKYFILIFVVIFAKQTQLNAQPGCYGCSGVAEVFFKVKNGETQHGYIALHGSYTSKIDFKKDENILSQLKYDDKINPRSDENDIKISTATKQYELKSLGTIYDKNDVNEIPLNEFEKIQFIKWLGGLGETSSLPILEKAKIDLLMNRPIRKEIKIEGMMGYIHFFNMDSSISEDEFSSFVKYNIHTLNNYNPLNSEIGKILRNENSDDNKSELGVSIKKTVNLIENELTSIDDLKNPKLRNYFGTIYSYYYNQKVLYESVLYFINHKSYTKIDSLIVDKEEFQNYVNKLQSKKIKTKTGFRTPEKYSDLFFKFSYLLKSNGKIRNDLIVPEYKKIIENLDIVVF